MRRRDHRSVCRDAFTTAPSTYRQSALDMSAPGTMGYLDELLVQAGGALTA